MEPKAPKQPLKWNIFVLLIAFPILCGSPGCSTREAGGIAVIPRTTATMLWEPEHGGAAAAGKKTGQRIYWNAPTREDDAAAQIALVERVAHDGFQGLVLAPDQVLGLMTPVRHAIDRGIFTVVIGSPLTIPAGDRLSYY